MTSPGEPLTHGLPAAAEYYRRVEEAYEDVFGEVSKTILPWVTAYTETGIPISLFRGATFRFECDRVTGKILVTTGITPGESSITSYHLTYETLADNGEEIELSSLLFPPIKKYTPLEYKKYHGEEYIDIARVIATKLAEPDTRLMSLELMPLRPETTELLGSIGQTAVN